MQSNKEILKSVDKTHLFKQCSHVKVNEESWNCEDCRVERDFALIRLAREVERDGRCPDCVWMVKTLCEKHVDELFEL